MIGCRIREGKDGEGKGKKERNKEGEKQGGGEGTLFAAMAESTLCAHSLMALAERVRHLIKVAIKPPFPEVLLCSRH